LLDSLNSDAFSEQTRNMAKYSLGRLDGMQGRLRDSDANFSGDHGDATADILVERVMRDALPGFQAPQERLRGLQREIAAWDTTEYHLHPPEVMENRYGEVKAFLTGVLDVRLGESDSLKKRLDYLSARPGSATPGDPAYAFARSLQGLWDWRTGSLDSALEILDDAQMQVNDVTYLRSAAIAESEGDEAGAARSYRRFIELWRDAEEELQPVVADARRRLEALLGLDSYKVAPA
jgi:hypothetical protein